MPKTKKTREEKRVQHITERSLAKIIGEKRPKVGGDDVFIWDRNQRGFGLRVYAPREAKQPTRAAFICRHAKGRATIGDATGAAAWSVADAREKAGEYTKAGKQGRDLRSEARAACEAERNAIKLGALIDLFLADREPHWRPRYYAEMERHLRRSAWKPLHGEPAFSIDRKKVAERVDVLAATTGKVNADRAKSALSAVYVWALDKSYDVTVNPAAGIKARAPSNGGRQRTLTDGELVEIWQALPDDDYGKVVKLLILTGQRRDEIGKLRWDEVVGDHIELDEARTKNHKRHVVPLSAEAVACLPARPNEHRVHVFGRLDSGYGGWSRSKKLLDAAILAARRKIDRKAAPMLHWTIHDLRRTVATMLREKRLADPHLVELILNHVGGLRSGVAGVYDRSERLEERREALEAWGRYIRKLVEPRQSLAA